VVRRINGRKRARHISLSIPEKTIGTEQSAVRFGGSCRMVSMSEGAELSVSMAMGLLTERRSFSRMPPEKDK